MGRRPLIAVVSSSSSPLFRCLLLHCTSSKQCRALTRWPAYILKAVSLSAAPREWSWSKHQYISVLYFSFFSIFLFNLWVLGKTVMVGKLGQRSVHKYLKSDSSVVMLSLGTGGIRNNRRPLDNEQPREYAEWYDVQWHLVCIYPNRLRDLALKHVSPGLVIIFLMNSKVGNQGWHRWGLTFRRRSKAGRARPSHLWSRKIWSTDKIGQRKRRKLRGLYQPEKDLACREDD